jgi:hydroxymethylpyrimidine pyrophosphatase-like HAD family hydrolase
MYLHNTRNPGIDVTICFDIDGTLIQSTDYTTGLSIPIETTINPLTIEDYVIARANIIDTFKTHILNLEKQGFKFMINTGRGIEFGQRIAKYLFPSNSVSVIIGESGAAILERDSSGYWNTKLTKPKSINDNDYKMLLLYKTSIEKIGREIGGSIELGKEIIVSINPSRETSIELFEEQIKTRMVSEGISLHKINLTRSSTAIDIGPRGATKIGSLRQVLGKSSLIYFGDAKNDAGVLEESDINVVVGNAEPFIQEIAKKAHLGILVHSGFNDMEGSIEGLRNLELLISAKGS